MAQLLVQLLFLYRKTFEGNAYVLPGHGSAVHGGAHLFLKAFLVCFDGFDRSHLLDDLCLDGRDHQFGFTEYLEDLEEFFLVGV